MSIQWDESLLLGHTTIDNQHIEIFNQINNLSDKITEGADDIEIRQLLNYLDTYAKKHFFEEEQLMLQHNYHGFHEQKRQHTEFKNEVAELTQMLRKKVKPGAMALRVEETLLQYFICHISEVDKELADFINDPESRPAVVARSRRK